MPTTDNSFDNWVPSNKVLVDGQVHKVNPGVEMATSRATDKSFPLSGVLIFGKHGAPKVNTAADKVLITNENEVQGTNPVATVECQRVANNKQSTSTRPTVENVNSLRVLPGMNWQN